MDEGYINKEELLNRYIEEPELLDEMLRQILDKGAYYLVFHKLPIHMDELELFEIKFGLAVFYTMRGFPLPDAPRWSDVVRKYPDGMERITREGAEQIILYIRKKLGEKRRRLERAGLRQYARRVDREFFFMPASF